MILRIQVWNADESATFAEVDLCVADSETERSRGELNYGITYALSNLSSALAHLEEEVRECFAEAAHNPNQQGD